MQTRKASAQEKTPSEALLNKDSPDELPALVSVAKTIHDRDQEPWDSENDTPGKHDREMQQRDLSH